MAMPGARGIRKITLSMRSWFSRESYQIQTPWRSAFATGVFLFLLMILMLGLLAQLVGQSDLSLWLPPPSVDGYDPEFDLRLNYLDAFVRQHGKVDCLLLGSSHVANGLDPAVIQKEYTQKTGQPLYCFNFGLSSLTADTAGPIATALVNKYHPRLVVFEISARSFSSRFGDLSRHLAENAWVRYQIGEPSPEGWALDHLYAYRYYLSLKAWQYPYNRKVVLGAMRSVGPLGFAPLHGQRPPEEDDPSNLEFELERPFWRGFQTVLGLNGQTQVVVVEAPVQETYLPVYLKGGRKAYEAKFIQPVLDELNARHIPLWRAQNEIAASLTAEMWHDNRHVNDQGSVLFSQWLADKLVLAFPPEFFK